MFQLSILIPCYNEEIYISQIIKDIQIWSATNNLNVEIIVGDNNSTDNSFKIAVEAGARVISVPKKGYGNVITEISKHATSDLLIFLDGDGQHNVEDLNLIYNELKTDVDLVIGNRFSKNARTHSTSFLKEYIGNPVLTKIGKFLFNSQIDDFHSGFRGVKKSVLSSLNLKSSGFELCSEMIAVAEIHKYKITQVPIVASMPFLGRRSNIRPIIDGIKHLKALINIALENRQYYRLFLFLIAINTFLISPFFLFIEGPMISPDTITYDKWSDQLMTFGVTKIVTDTDYVFSKLFYFFHLSFIALCKIAAGNHWKYLHFITNIVLHILTGVLIFYNSYKLTKDGAVALFSNVLFYFSIDSITITFCLLSDTVFVFLLSLFFAIYLCSSDLKKYFTASFLALLLIIVFYRPTGINILATVLFFTFLQKVKIDVSKRVIYNFLLVAGLFLFSYNMYVLSMGEDYIKELSLKFLRTKFLYDAKGIVIWDRYIFDKISDNSTLNAFLFYGQKLIRFFQFYVPQYSLVHNLMNFTFFVPAYFSLFYLMLSKSITKKEILLILFFIFTTAFFHTFTVIDFDWRYRLILIPFLCNLCAIGLQKLLYKYD
jgi:glycosyltransferase involved in cell wall biosynthesis